MIDLYVLERFSGPVYLSFLGVYISNLNRANFMANSMFKSYREMDTGKNHKRWQTNILTDFRVKDVHFFSYLYLNVFSKNKIRSHQLCRAEVQTLHERK